jgi:hypothetical protein
MPGTNGPNKPGRLTTLRRWLTVPEAARYLALVFGDDVTEADILRFGLDGQLKLSVRFVNFANAVRHHERTETPAELAAGLEAFLQRLAEVKAAKDAGLPTPPRQKPVRSPEEEQQAEEERRVVTLSDEIYDLPMIGGGRHDVEHAYQQQTGGPEVTLIDLDGPFVDTADGTRFALRERLPKEIQTANGIVVTDRAWYPPGRLPDDSVLVVRTTALRELERRVIDSTETSADSIGRPLKERERATLLTMVAVLADRAGIDISKPSKAALAIEALSIAKGARVSARTVEDQTARRPCRGKIARPGSATGHCSRRSRYSGEKATGRPTTRQH